MSKRRYEKDRPVRSIAEFESCGADWFIWMGRTKHRSVLCNQQYRALKYFIERGEIWTAKWISGKEVVPSGHEEAAAGSPDR